MLRMQGYSMVPKFESGDILLIAPEKAFTDTNGGPGVVKYNSEFKTRYVYMRADNYLLEPANKAFETEIVPVT